MLNTSLANTIKNYLMVCIALVVTIALIVTNYFIENPSFHWETVLWVSLALSILGMAGQLVSAEKKLKVTSGQLAANKERLNNEIKHRLWAEKTTSENKIKSQFIDENIPVMLAYFNTEQRCRYHNRIFRRWFGLKPDQIDGHLLQEFTNEEFFSDIKDRIDEVISGKTVHNERTLNSTKGFPYIFSEQYIPHIDNQGKTIGFYTLITPRAQEKKRPIAKSSIAVSKPKAAPTDKSANIQEKDATISRDQSSKSGITAARIEQAIQEGEFNLYCQKIVPVKSNSTSLIHQEVLIRMAEEENNLMPPGSFLPFVDQFKMMPKLDRWVVENMLMWLSERKTASEAEQIFCLNVARDTLSDTHFPSFVQRKLKELKVTSHLLCFEVEESDARANPEAALIFSEKIRKLGCLVSLCSFSYNKASVGLLNKMKVDYLKIDGSLVCNILYDDEYLEQVVAINQLAIKIKAKTIAELVETNDIVVKLREIGVDFAQGFHIAKPIPLQASNN
ncbi:MAG: EAL domain-containing protein [Betaproteobacteria bacterium]|nr:EAL domain-containing protein [Betaproteobacteria bacterium]